MLHGNPIFHGFAKQQLIIKWVTIYVAEDSKKYCKARQRPLFHQVVMHNNHFLYAQ